MPVTIFGREYKTVAERLDELCKSGKEYSLNTEIISWENGIIIMKATLQIGENTYTGHAYEVEGSSQINTTSALENAETSCIGRSLASAGMGGSEFASADELANALGQQNNVSTENNTSPFNSQIRTSGNTTFTGSSKVGWSEESRTSKITFGKYKGMRWSELSFNYVEWVATKSSLGDEFKDFASAELEHRNEALEGMKAETVVGKVIGVDDPVAYNEAVEKNRQDMVDKAKARNRTDDAMEQVDGLIGDLKKAGKPTKAKKVSKKNKYTKDYAEKVVAKLEKKSEEKVKKTKAPTPEPEQLSWDEIKEESAKTLDG
jgi:uncharacterized protein (DUF3820 family)